MDDWDEKIKKKLQNDQLISKKAEDIFNNFLKEDERMDKKDIKELNSKPRKKVWTKILATAACLLVLIGGNIYASTKGYGNIFFLIKYLFTGENITTTDKNDILSDRDIAISYETIKLTENIKMQIRNLRIKDNNAELILIINENYDEYDLNMLTLNYKVYNSKGELICAQNSSKKTQNENVYQEKLLLKNVDINDNILILEVYQSNNTKIAKITIDINTKEIAIEGEKEALKKISEIELKDFFAIITAHDEQWTNNEDARILLTREVIESGLAKVEGINTELGNIYKVEDVNNLLESMGYDRIPDSFKKGLMYTKRKINGIEYFDQLDERRNFFKNTVFNINDLSYCGGIYTASFNYAFIHPSLAYDLEDNYDINIKNATIYFKVNEDTKYSTFRVIKYEKNTEEFIDNTLEIENNTTQENKTETVKNETTEDILKRIKTYLSNVNNDSISNNYNIKVRFRKFENNTTQKDIQTSTMILSSLIGRINDNINNIDNKTTYAEWCSRKMTYDREKYSMMFTYRNHQSHIYWGETEDENQIVIMWYDENRNDMEINKINLNINAKTIFDDLMGQYGNGDTTESNQQENTNNENELSEEIKYLTNGTGQWNLYNVYLNDRQNNIYKEVPMEDITDNPVTTGIQFNKNGTFVGNVIGVQNEHTGTYSITNSIITLKFKNQTIKLEWAPNSIKFRQQYGKYEIIYEKKE